MFGGRSLTSHSVLSGVCSLSCTIWGSHLPPRLHHSFHHDGQWLWSQEGLTLPSAAVQLEVGQPWFPHPQ